MFSNETMITETLFKQKCRHFYKHGARQEACIFIPLNATFYVFEFGTGDNLLPEDFELGYDSYINIESHRFDEEGMSLIDGDGGIFLYSEDDFDSDNIWSYIPSAIQETDAFDIAQRTGLYPDFIYI